MLAFWKKDYFALEQLAYLILEAASVILEPGQNW